jgi:von Willebrand factor type A domain/Aerotolerance regulator N-terminal
MSLANPSALLWAALAVPIVLFYLTRVRVRQLPVGSEMFWDRVFVENRRHAVWRKVRNLVSLLVQLALLSLLVLALSEPVLPWESKEPRRVVLVLDVSASMAARDGADRGDTRLEAARREARRLLAGLRDHDEAALVVAGGRAHVACGMTDDRRALRDAIDAAAGTDGSAALPDAVALARRLLAGHAHGEVVVLSDGCGDGSAALAETEGVRLVRVGAAVDNVGIARFQARRSLHNPTGFEVLAEVGNFSDASVECRLILELDEVVVDVIPLNLSANGTWREVSEMASAAGGRLRARLDRDDALAADNEAWAILPPCEPIAVTLVTEGERFANLYVEKVLEASPLVKQPVTIVVAKGRATPPDTPVTVYYRTVPATLPAGAALVIDPNGPSDLWDIGGPAAPLVGRVDRESPVMAHVRLENVRLTGHKSITPKGKVQVLATSVGDDTLCFAADRPAGRVIVLSVNLEQGDLPLRTAFPILVTNAVAWLAGQREELRESAASGGFITVTLPQSTAGAELSLWSPDGIGRRLPAGTDRVALGPLDRRGVWRVAAASDGPAVTEVACNLANRSESDLRPTPMPAATANERAAPAMPRAARYYLSVLVFVLLVVEWCLFQRRRIG